MENMSQPLAQAVMYVMNVLNTIAHINIPGTNLPIIIIMGGVWGMYFIWRWVLAHIFDMEVKK